MGFNKKKKQLSKKNRQTKSVLVFDEKARKDFLTGFKKRKDERRRKAQEQVQKMIKEDRKLLRQKMKEFSQVKTKSQKLQPDLEELAEKHVMELPHHTVTITDISEREDSDTEERVSDNNEGREDVPEVSIHKHDKSVKSIKHKIQKTSKHLKQKKSKFKKAKTLSKKSRQKKKRSLQNY